MLVTIDLSVFKDSALALETYQWKKTQHVNDSKKFLDLGDASFQVQRGLGSTVLDDNVYIVLRNVFFHVPYQEAPLFTIKGTLPI